MSGPSRDPLDATDSASVGVVTKISDRSDTDSVYDEEGADLAGTALEVYNVSDCDRIRSGRKQRTCKDGKQAVHWDLQ